MSAFVVWMDSESAKIFHINGEAVSVVKAENHVIDHHTQNKHDAKTKSPHKFYSAIYDHLNKVKDSILLVGPGKSKNHFISFLDEHHMSDVAKRVLGTEPMDHPTDAQLVAYARCYFPNGI